MFYFIVPTCILSIFTDIYSVVPVVKLIDVLDVSEHSVILVVETKWDVL